MRTSSVKHPAKEPLIVIRQWQVEACDGNTTAAALLSFFEYWHDIKVDMVRQNFRANDIAEQHGDGRLHSESVIQWHTEQELVDGIMGIAKRETIKKGLDLLVSKGFITIAKNPNPRYKFDRTRYFYFHPEVLNTWLDSRPSKNDSPSSKNRPRSTENRGTITETSTRDYKPENKIHMNGKAESARATNSEAPDFNPEEEVVRDCNDAEDFNQSGNKNEFILVGNIPPASRKIVEFENEMMIRGEWHLPWEIRKGNETRYDADFVRWFYSKYREHENLPQGGVEANIEAIDYYMRLARAGSQDVDMFGTSKKDERDKRSWDRRQFLMDTWNEFVDPNY